MATKLLAPSPRFRYFDANGDPLALGKVHTYTSGTSTPFSTWADADGAGLNTNPVILDANGEADIYLTPMQAYRFVVKSAADVTLTTTDGVYGASPGNSLTVGQLMGTAGLLDIDTDGTLAANSDAKIATQKAVKTYVDEVSALALSAEGGTIAGNLSVTGTITATGLITGAGLDAGGQRVTNVAAPVSGTDAVNKTYADALASGLTIVPAGAIVAYGSITIPSGWLECAGQAVSRTTYSTLFGILGITYGAGDGVTTFGLPDLRGEFVRGFDHGRGVDSGRVLGAAQSDLIKAHTHTHGTGVGSGVGSTTGGGFAAINQAGDGSTTPTQTASTGGAENRPRNQSVVYIVKT